VRVGLSERSRVTNQFDNWRGSAAAQCGKAMPFRSGLLISGGYASSSEAQPQKKRERVGGKP
jgi:hypothetical protein